VPYRTTLLTTFVTVFFDLTLAVELGMVLAACSSSTACPSSPASSACP
jgi:MFS superfamily sulfate permease-like transporter